MSNVNASSLDPAELDNLCINTIRFLSVDAVEKANSGHPGLPMGAAPMAYVLWTRFLKVIRTIHIGSTGTFCPVGRTRFDAAL